MIDLSGIDTGCSTVAPVISACALLRLLNSVAINVMQNLLISLKLSIPELLLKTGAGCNV
jgi:hypothetical protein